MARKPQRGGAGNSAATHSPGAGLLFVSARGRAVTVPDTTASAPEAHPLRDRMRRVMRYEIVRLAGGSAYAYGLRISGAACSFATQVILARWLGPETLGVYTFAAAALTMAAFLATLGLPNAGLRAIPHDMALERWALARGFVAFARRTLALSGAAAALALLAAAWLFAPANAFPAIAIACLGVPAMAQAVMQDAAARSVRLQTLSFLPAQLGRPALLLSAVVVLWSVRPQAGAADVAAMLVGAIVTTALLQFVALRRPLSARLQRGPVQETPRAWLALALPLILTVGYTSYFLEANVLAAGLVLPARDVALFGVALQVTNLASYFLAAVNLQFAPQAAALYARDERTTLQSLIRRATRLRVAFALLMVAGFVLLGRPFLTLFGPEFADAYTALTILGAAQLVAAACGPTAQILAVTGHHREGAAVSAAALALNLVLMLALAPRFGLEGAALAAFAATSLWSVALAVLVVRRSGFQPAIIPFGGVRS